MRFYTKQHRYYCGIDLHARSMYVCILDPQGEILLHRNMPCGPDFFLKAIAPYREDMAVAVECIFTWYWLADLCSKENIPFVLGHALYMKAIHGGKAKNDKIDAHKIAVLLRGGMLPMAYVYPALMRSTQDLLRRRMHLMHKRSSFSPTSKTPPASTVCPSSVRRSLIRKTAREWPSTSPTQACVSPSRWTSRSSITTTSCSLR